MKRVILNILFAVMIGLTLMACALCLGSCNVTRTISNESQYVQRGDTSAVIHTKTIETYDASRKGGVRGIY